MRLEKCARKLSSRPGACLVPCRRVSEGAVLVAEDPRTGAKQSEMHQVMVSPRATGHALLAMDIIDTARVLGC
ncbi:hypothetical protein N7510_005753 [Penicillium lagena]|uniref:uncharacterized protein n=1 Tax=Penicillium lagena TaxID=94218 RepID=UPI002540721E|nr:uncharacterized protein N7510_005753 [Penicillium lagena]KAJ5612559.1 hypothetical protein N7510_005753 [Penicillium lagena]